MEPVTTFHDDALLRLGNSLLETGQREAAAASYLRLIMEYPDFSARAEIIAKSREIANLDQ